MDTAVALVRVYLELCGYFVLTELPVRARAGRGYRDVTDVDIIAVRFPQEGRAMPFTSETPLYLLMSADQQLGTSDDEVDVIVVEVKESGARLNPALRRKETVDFALRRLGCSPEEMVETEASQIVSAGRREFTMPGGMRCNVRLVMFAGHATRSAEPGSSRFGTAWLSYDSVSAPEEKCPAVRSSRIRCSALWSLKTSKLSGSSQPGNLTWAARPGPAQRLT